jgi:hypothetical protein
MAVVSIDHPVGPIRCFQARGRAALGVAGAG